MKFEMYALSCAAQLSRVARQVASDPDPSNVASIWVPAMRIRATRLKNALAECTGGTCSAEVRIAVCTSFAQLSLCAVSAHPSGYMLESDAEMKAVYAAGLYVVNHRSEPSASAATYAALVRDAARAASRASRSIGVPSRSARGPGPTSCSNTGACSRYPASSSRGLVSNRRVGVECERARAARPV